MKTFHVNFFKNLASSDGHQYKCLQNSLAVRADDPADALLSAEKQFAQLKHAANWTLYADSVELVEET
jgi:hypothetical protein